MAITKFHKLIYAAITLMLTSSILSSYASRGFISCARAYKPNQKTILVVSFSRHGARAPSNTEFAT